MKGYATLPKGTEFEPHHQMQFKVIPGHSFFGGGDRKLPSIQSLYSKPFQQGRYILIKISYNLRANPVQRMTVLWDRHEPHYSDFTKEKKIIWIKAMSSSD